LKVPDDGRGGFVLLRPSRFELGAARTNREGQIISGATEVNDKRTVLHIDDDPAILRLVAGRLAKEGYEVVSSSDPADIEGLLLESNARVCLLDISMPHADGLEVLKQIKRYDGGVQVVMLTGLVSMNAVLDSLRNGAEALHFKPILDFEPLLEILSDCFRKTERWRQTLEELRARRSQSLTMA
jgi:DNA-binding NtrC family response regulator